MENCLVFWLVADYRFWPSLADPTLRCVYPKVALLDVLVTKNSWEYDLVHVSRHWVFDQLLIGGLIDTHEH